MRSLKSLYGRVLFQVKENLKKYLKKHFKKKLLFRTSFSYMDIDATLSSQINDITSSQQLYLTAHENGAIECIDKLNGQLIKRIPKTNASGISCLLMSQPFQLVTGDTNGSLRWWDIRTFQCLQEISLPIEKAEAGISALASQTGSLLMAATADGQLKTFS
jgi:WD40 repeat protein